MTKRCTTLNLDAFEWTKSAVEADPTAGQGSFGTTTTWWQPRQAERAAS